MQKRRLPRLYIAYNAMYFLAEMNTRGSKNCTQIMITGADYQLIKTSFSAIVGYYIMMSKKDDFVN